VKCFLLKFINAIKNIELKNYRNALGSVQRCITNIFILDVQDFMLIINTLLLEAGEKFNYVPIKEEEANYV